MSQRRDEGKIDIFAQPHADIDEVADEIYGKSEPGLNTGVMRAKPIPIMSIRPDRAQPRRAIPMVVCGEWDGSPEAIPALLGTWYQGAVHQYGKRFDVAQILKGMKSLELPEDAGAVLVGFNKLMSLAASIRNEGLTNPITVVRDGAGYMVETGERRLLAHHLLNMYLDDGQWERIPAREVEFDVFRQASENNARDSLNAIQMARQIALLIMAERDHMDGHDYASYNDLVLAGESDRRFYAQVANGNIHRIPMGSGDKISHAVGLSMARISQYRRLLSLTDDEELNDKIWLEADTNDWSENYIREYVQSLTVVKHADEDEETLTVVKVDDEVEGRRARFLPGDQSFGRPAGSLPPSSAYRDEAQSLPKPPALSGNSGYVPDVERFEAEGDGSLGLQNALYDEQLVKEVNISSLVAQFVHMARVMNDEAAAEMLLDLMKLSTGDVRRMSAEMSQDEFAQYLNKLADTVGLLMEDATGRFYKALSVWDVMDKEIRGN